MVNRGIVLALVVILGLLALARPALAAGCQSLYADAGIALSLCDSGYQVDVVPGQSVSVATWTPTDTPTSTPTSTPTATATPIGWTLQPGTSIQVFCTVGAPDVGTVSGASVLIRCPDDVPPGSPTPTSTPTITPAAIAGGATTPTSFALSNPNPSPVSVEASYMRANGTVVATNLWTTVPGRATAVVDVGKVPAVPTGFVGSVILIADQPFGAAIVTPGVTQ